MYLVSFITWIPNCTPPLPPLCFVWSHCDCQSQTGFLPDLIGWIIKLFSLSRLFFFTAILIKPSALSIKKKQKTTTLPMTNINTPLFGDHLFHAACTETSHLRISKYIKIQREQERKDGRPWMERRWREGCIGFLCDASCFPWAASFCTLSGSDRLDKASTWSYSFGFGGGGGRESLNTRKKGKGFCLSVACQ